MEKEGGKFFGLRIMGINIVGGVWGEVKKYKKVRRRLVTEDNEKKI